MSFTFYTLIDRFNAKGPNETAKHQQMLLEVQRTCDADEPDIDLCDLACESIKEFCEPYCSDVPYDTELFCIELCTWGNIE